MKSRIRCMCDRVTHNGILPASAICFVFVMVGMLLILAPIIQPTPTNASVITSRTQDQPQTTNGNSFAPLNRSAVPPSPPKAILRLSSPCPDFNETGPVDAADVMAVAARWGQQSTDPGWDGNFDLDGDGDTDGYDVGQVASAWRSRCFPPDPATVAPPLDRTVATDLATATEFLYTGSDPIQTGVVSGTIEARRVAVLRGRVLTQAGEPLSGVEITVLNHPEYGQTLSRLDGMFDMAVNGGGPLTVSYARDGYLPVQRHVNAPWQDYAWLPEVVLIPLDSQVTTIILTDTTPIQVAQGSVISDTDGTRQATLFVPQGTQAELVLPGGVTQTLTSLGIRATEYTVGASGPEAMPAELPPTSGYTYAVELSADEALAAGAVAVRFDRPLPYYVENFLGFPVGSAVPVGYYDRDQGQWVPSQNGTVIEVLSITSGAADLDTDGDSIADDAATLAALGITEAERRSLAGLYLPGESLWRVPISHFTPSDCNWPFACVGACEPPDMPAPGDDTLDDPCFKTGSIIRCQNQSLAEMAAVTGTPFSLHYDSERVAGYSAGRTLSIPLTDYLPDGLKYIDLWIYVAGRSFREIFRTPKAQMVYEFRWDGKDGYGRSVQGTQLATVKIGYVYPVGYVSPADAAQSFALVSPYDFAVSRDNFEITLWQTMLAPLRFWDALPQGLGGWSLDVHHIYDPKAKTLYLGNGIRRSTESPGPVINTVAGSDASPFGGDGGRATDAAMDRPAGVAVGADGSYYIADIYNRRIRQVKPGGIITTVVGGGNPPDQIGDGLEATQAYLYEPFGVAVGPDGSLYIADSGTHRIRRVGPGGIISTVAGSDPCCHAGGGYSGDYGPATQAQLKDPLDVALGPDGSLYIADTGNNRIRRVGTDGIITTVAGNGNRNLSGDGGLASQAELGQPHGIAVGPDGSLYIADTYNRRVRKVSADGIITTVVGSGCGYLCDGDSGDGGLATEARLSQPYGVALGPDGSLYISDHAAHRIRLVTPDGIIRTLAGRGMNVWGFSGDGGPSAAAILDRPWDAAVAPDGSLYFADQFNNRIRRVSHLLAGSVLTEQFVAAEDGSEIYVFDEAGRHLRTLHALTQATLYRFSYDDAGQLAAVTDGDGNTTTIERDLAGDPTAIVSPDGQRTTLAIGSSGYLERITDPAGHVTQYSYDPHGSLVGMTDPRGSTYTYTYDSVGRLTVDQDPTGGTQTLTRVAQAGRGYIVSHSSALSRTTSYEVAYLFDGGERRTNTFPSGLQTEWLRHVDDSRTTRFPDGSATRSVRGPDPRWGMQSPIEASTVVSMPSGLHASFAVTRTATLIDPYDLFSMARLTEMNSVNGQAYTTVYDAASQTFAQTTPEGRQSWAAIDAQGRPVLTELDGLLPAHYQYDSRGRLTAVTVGEGPQARTTGFTYNADGYLDAITDPLGRAVGLGYDAAGRIVTQTLPGGRVVTLGYDAGGNVTSITPPGRPAHTFDHTPLGLTSVYTPPVVIPGTNSTQYAYNADRQLTHVARPDGQSVDIGYDSAGRLSSLTMARGVVSYTYDASTGHLAAIAAPGGLGLAFSHDGALLTGETWNGAVTGVVSRTYDSHFRLASLAVGGGGSVTLAYDHDSLLTRAGALILQRSAQTGLLSGTTLDNLTDTWTYNGFGERVSYNATYGGAGLLARQYARDKLGRITAITETVGGATDVYSYTYDLAGRLTSAWKNGGPQGSYTYDSNGNRLSHTGPGGTVTGTYDDQDRLTQYGATSYAYTASGELLSKSVAGQTTTYSYDALGNLTAVTLPGGTQIYYLVDGQNQRIGKMMDGVLVQGLLYQDSLRPIAELDESGNVISRFVYGTRANVPDYMVKGGVIYRIVADHLGSPGLVVNVSTGEIVQRMDYDEFGNVISDTNPGFQPFGFAGGLYDPDTKLVRCGVRDYDAETGRWTTKDPIRFWGGDTNLYGYVLNDPVNEIDPSGEAVSSPVAEHMLRTFYEYWADWLYRFWYGYDRPKGKPLPTDNSCDADWDPCNGPPPPMICADPNPFPRHPEPHETEHSHEPHTEVGEPEYPEHYRTGTRTFREEAVWRYTTSRWVVPPRVMP
jgi:RHS repeat-associated protein